MDIKRPTETVKIWTWEGKEKVFSQAQIPHVRPGESAWQRQLRDQYRTDDEGMASLDTSEVKPISAKEAETIILKYEWLGNMGTTEIAFGLYWREKLAGVVCFGKTAGTNTSVSVCGAEWAQNMTTLCRGACVSWAHPNSASYLINASCSVLASKPWKTFKGVARPPSYIFVAYSDSDAGEIGTVYQAANWLYCGKTAGTTMYREPSGSGWSEWKDTKLIHSSTRIREGRSREPDEKGRFFIFDEWKGQKFYAGQKLPDGRLVLGGKDYPYLQEITREDRLKELKNRGCQFRKGEPKHRYVGIFGDKRTKRLVRKALKWPVLPYPKRVAATLTGSADGTTIGDVVRAHGVAPNL
jgi:hypothetical protein